MHELYVRSYMKLFMIVYVVLDVWIKNESEEGIK
jgi:hypothetical protein